MIQPKTHTKIWPSRPGGDRFRPLVFGEALFDHFPDGSRSLGGAPFNVAWHLRGFKADPCLVTAIGRDEAGQEILDRMARWHLDTSGVQIHPTRPTGRVVTHLDGGQPRYDIEARQAYDAISTGQLPPPPTLASTSLLYHGSLATREETSAQCLDYLRSHLDVPVLVDVNLRDPWWSLDRTPERFRKAEWIKVNREEVGLLSGKAIGTDEQVVRAAEALRERLEAGTLVVTLGGDGALALGDDGLVYADASAQAEIVDTVGAGDAFAAVLALGINDQWPLPVALERASEFAGELCRVRGAIPSDPGLYSHHMLRWGHAS